MRSIRHNRHTRSGSIAPVGPPGLTHSIHASDARVLRRPVTTTGAIIGSRRDARRSQQRPDGNTKGAHNASLLDPTNAHTERPVVQGPPGLVGQAAASAT